MPTTLDGVKHQSLLPSEVNETWTGEDLAYAAGIVDGEGCIVAKRSAVKFRGFPAYSLSVIVGMADPEAVDWLKGTFGGYIYGYDQKGAGKRPMHRWMLSGLRCQYFLKLLLPYLKVKRDQAEVAIGFPARPRSGRRGRPLEIIEQQEAAYWRLRELKSPSAREDW